MTVMTVFAAMSANRYYKQATGHVQMQSTGSVSCHCLTLQRCDERVITLTSSSVTGSKPASTILHPLMSAIAPAPNCLTLTPFPHVSHTTACPPHTSHAFTPTLAMKDAGLSP